MFKEYFLLQKFFEKRSQRHYKYKKQTYSNKSDSMVCTVHPTGESSTRVCIPPRSQVIKISQKLCGLHLTAESNSAVCIKPRSQALLCASHRGVKLCGVHHSAESNCTPQSQNQNLCESLVPFKGTIRRNPFRGSHIYHERKNLKDFFLIC